MKKQRKTKLKYTEEELFLYPPMTKKQIAVYQMRKSEQARVFLRVNWKKRVNGVVMKSAGYPVSIPTKDGWKEIHDWCKENLKNKFGIAEYTWTDEKFWFPNDSVKIKFVEEWGDNSGNS